MSAKAHPKSRLLCCKMLKGDSILKLFFTGLLLLAATFKSYGDEIKIDSSWISNYESTFGAAPYLLDKPNTTYVLDQDITVTGTAFVVAGNDITLDLNGRSIVYGDIEEITVPNGGFEEGKAGWDLSGTQGAAIVANTKYLFGKKVLRLQDLTTKQTLRSSRIRIDDPNHIYIASITPGNRADWRTQLVLSVKDANTGDVLKNYEYRKDRWIDATGKSGNVERGFSAVAKFYPARTKTTEIILEVTILPASDKAGRPVATTIDLDYAMVVPAYDYGILATRKWHKEVDGFFQYPAHLEKKYRNAGNFSLMNGTVKQGRGRGYKSSPLYFDNLDGFRIDGVELFANGMSTTTISAKNLDGGDKSAAETIIRNSVLDHDIDNVHNRMHTVAAIEAFGNTDIKIENNRILNAPQLGIAGGNKAKFKYQVTGNKIFNKATVTNSYAISVVGIQNFEIAYNEVKTKNGRGILIDGYTSQPTENGYIHHNDVDVTEEPNREYVKGGSARALRIRNNVDAEGPHRNLHILENSFVARTGNESVKDAYGGRITYVNRDGQMDDANIVVEKNLFKAITNSKEKKAIGFVLNGMEKNINPVFRDNVFESNHISLQLTDADGGSDYDTTFVNNTIVRSKDGLKMPYQAVRAGWGAGKWARSVTNVSLLGTKLENTDELKIHWSGEGRKQVIVGWNLDLKASSGKESPGKGNVNIFNAAGDKVFKGETDQNGTINGIQLIAKEYRQEGKDSKKIQVTDYNPMFMEVDYNGDTVTRSFTLDRNRIEELGN